MELVAEVTPAMLGYGGPAEADPCPAPLTPGTYAEGATAPAKTLPIAAWTGSRRQEWLPFSSLMATSQSAADGWGGEIVTMPPGTQPEACQALCLASDPCAAFSFDHGGAFFIGAARCPLVGYGSERDLTRDNIDFEGGVFFASDLKPDARFPTPNSEALAAQILADMSRSPKPALACA